jgi:hypothetical protein
VALSIGMPDGSAPPAAQSVREPLRVDAPFQVEHEEDGLKIVVGIPRAQPALGLYNRGLTLLETHEELVPGLSVKAVSRWLEHTLTRDNVRRDKGFARVAKKAKELAEGPLKARLSEELRRTATDPTLREDWRVVFHYAYSRLKPGQLWLRRPGGGALEGEQVYKRSPARSLWVAERRSPLVERLDAAGVPVVEAMPQDTLDGLLRRFELKEAMSAEAMWTHAEPISLDSAPAFSAALCDALELLRSPARTVVVTRLHGACAELPFAVVPALGKPVMASTAAGSPFGRKAEPTLVLNSGHSDIARLGPLFDRAPRLAALLVARRLAVYFGALNEESERALTGWALS